jgi:hypothetical protein
MCQDPIVAEVRRVREVHAAQFDYDLKAIYRDLREQEDKAQLTTVSLPAKRISEKEQPAGKVADVVIQAHLEAIACRDE